MKCNFKHEPTYYIIVKDVRMVDNEDKPVIGSGPIEVTTNEALAIEHVYKLNAMKEQLAAIIKDDNPEKIKECEIEFRLCTLDEASNATAKNLIAAYDEDVKNESNGEQESSHD